VASLASSFRFRSGSPLLVIGALLLSGQTPPRSIAEGVYSRAQAARGQQVYNGQCASCHGNALQGGGGPPLAGDAFLANWSLQPLKNLVDKIQKTMPFDQQGTLSRNQSLDLAAFILQGGKFPAGPSELSEVVLAQTVFPAGQSPANPAASSAGPSFVAPEGNLAELMRAIAFPNSNIIFNVQIHDPGKKKEPKPNPPEFDYVEWGSNIYPGWMMIDQAAIALTETAPLLLTPGRKCQNGKPVPVDREDWKKYVADMVEVGRLAHKASQARDFEAFVDISEKLNEACLNCHRVYRDRGGRNGENRCVAAAAPAKPAVKQ